MRAKKVTTGELSEILGVSLRTVQRLAQTGVLEADGVQNRNKMYDLPDAVQRYIAYVREQYEKNDDKQKSVTQLKEDKLKAEIELKQSQNELHQIKTAMMKGEYLPVEDVQADYERFFVVLKKFISAIPARISGQLAGYVEPVVMRRLEKDLQTDLSAMLRTFVVAGKASNRA